jgi:hypothetical protein
MWNSVECTMLETAQMSVAATTFDAPVARPRTTPWIESAPFDVISFTAAPLIGLLFLLAATNGLGTRWLGITFFLVGTMHYFSTFTFFMGDENLSYSRMRPLAYFAVPVVIVIAVATLRFGAGLNVLLTAIFLWNAWHVSLQSCGIASVYRHRAGGHPSEKRAVNLAILGVNGALIAYAIPRFDPLNGFLRAIWPQLPRVLFFVVVTLAFVAGLYFAIDVLRRMRAGRRYGGAETVFLISSFLLFHPYAWIQSSELATTGMLLGHFVQYLALIWLLNWRKYATLSGSLAQNALAFASRKPLLGALGLLVMAVGWYELDRVTQHFHSRQVFFWAWNSLVLMHFYLDGLIWSFKNPFVRKTIGPYL